MEIRKCQLEFVTPAFVGDADQHAQWRTPPIKALLRHWWRIAMHASTPAGQWQQVRSVEFALFGSVDPDSGQRSRIRLRLNKWSPGQILPLAKSQPGRGVGNDPLVYLGYGKVDAGKKAIPPGEHATLRLVWPGDHAGAQVLDQALALINAFGTLGGRSRNAWGSLRLTLDNALPALEPGLLVDVREALGRSWPTGIGFDAAGPLIWKGRDRKSWEHALGELATLRRQLRHSPGIEPLMLAYPARKTLNGLASGARIPNSLRFKVLRTSSGEFRPIAFHVPVRPADELLKLPDAPRRDFLRAFVDNWQKAHAAVDGMDQFVRVHDLQECAQ